MTVTLTRETAVIVVLTAGVLGGLWGGMISVFATLNGPDWAVKHLRRTYPIALAATVASVAVLVFVRPLWVGVGVVYVTGIIAWMSRNVTRTLERLRAGGEFEDLPLERRRAVLMRSGRWLLIAGAAFAVFAIFDYRWRGSAALFDWVLVALLVIPGLLVVQKARSLG